MPRPLPTIMISSTARDLPEHRQRVMDACLRQSVHPIMMEHLPAKDEDAITTSLSMVDQADIYLGVFGYRYGYVPAGHEISITEMEYNRAVERRIPRLIFLMHEEHPVKPSDVERGLSGDKLDAFRQRVSLERVVAFFHSPDELQVKVIQSLVDVLFQISPTDHTSFPTIQQRIDRLEELRRQSIARCIERWQDAGVPRIEALNFATDPAVGSRKSLLEPHQEKPLLVLVAELGMGKSLFAERLFQDAIADAIQN